MALDAIRTDTTGPINPHDKLGKNYLKLFVDAATGWATRHAMKNNSRAGVIIASMIKAIQTKAGTLVKILHSDNAKEQDTNSLRKFLHEEGIEHTKTAPHSSQHNGTVERRF